MTWKHESFQNFMIMNHIMLIFIFSQVFFVAHTQNNYLV